MSISMIQAFKKTTLKPTERLVAFMLADHWNDQTGRCHPSVRLLAQETGLTVRSVISALQKLDDSGYITKLETERTGQNRHYILHPEKGGKAVKDVHRCNTFTGEGDSQGVVKDVHRGGEGDSPEAVKEIHLNSNKPEENHNINRKDVSFSLSAETPNQEKGKPFNLDEVIRFAESKGIDKFDAETFWHMMEAAGWMRGKQKLKDWRGHLITYDRLGYLKPKSTNHSTQQPAGRAGIIF